jgi:hypothetical protein
MLLDLKSAIGPVITGFGALLILAFYFFLIWDARRADSPSHGDGQVGLKVTLYTFYLVAIGYGAMGLVEVLHYLLSGADTGTANLKSGLAGVLAGGVVTVMVWKGLLPRTNHTQYPKAERLAYGTLAATGGVALIGALVTLIDAVIVWPSWLQVSGALARVIVLGLITTLSLLRFGRMSGWVAPQPPPPPPHHPPQGYGGPPPGYPPQGYPPPGGGYPPAGGGYPPAGGGYPPAGGGYPPPGGGYPPR